MSVNAKHLATFVLGAAAGVALNKYLQTEEGEKTLEDLKAKAADLQTQAEGAIENAPAYFEKLKEEAATMMQEKFPEAEKFLAELLGKINPAVNPTINVDPK